MTETNKITLYDMIQDLILPFSDKKVDCENSREALQKLRAYSFICDDTYSRIGNLLPDRTMEATDFYINGDVSYTDKNKENWSVRIDPAKAIAWIIGMLHDDFQFRKRLGFVFNSMDELKDAACRFNVASFEEMHNYRSYFSRNCRVTESGIFMIAENEGKRCLFYLPAECDKNKLLPPIAMGRGKMIEMCSDLEGTITENEKDLYFKYRERDAYRRVNYETGEEETVCGINILGFSDDNRMVFYDTDKNKICIEAGEHMIDLCSGENCEYYFNTDHIVVIQKDLKLLPYKVDLNGNRLFLSKGELSRIFWLRTIKGSAEFYRQMGINAQFAFKSVLTYAEQSELSISGLRSVLKKIRTTGSLLRKTECDVIAGIINLVDKVVKDKHKDLSGLMYKILKFSKDCSAEGKEGFSKEFRKTMVSLSNEDSFREKLLNHPNEIFQSYCPERKVPGIRWLTDNLPFNS